MSVQWAQAASQPSVNPNHLSAGLDLPGKHNRYCGTPHLGFNIWRGAAHALSDTAQNRPHGHNREQSDDPKVN